MVANSDERKARIHDLDMKHQSSIHQIDLVNRDEEARRLKLRVLALRDDNATLKDQITQRDGRLMLLQRQSDDVRAELVEAKETTKKQEQQLQKQTKELTNLKTEIEALNGTMQDSSTALQEKFALARELNRMKPEMEDLRAQLANYSAVVAEKLDLRRQVDSLEVELQNEKRSKQRKKVQDEAVDEWKSKFEEAQKMHNAEKKEHQKQLREMQGENERLEERVSTMKLKLKNVQSELKDAQAELERCQEELVAARKASKAAGKKPEKKVAVKEQVQAGRKRRANELSLEDITIGTPGADEAAKRIAAKRGVDRALAGEKSTFSITPFLNRTKNVSDDSIEEASPTGKAAEVSEPIVEEDEEDLPLISEEPEPEPEPPVEKAKKVPAKAPKSTTRGRPKKALAEAPLAKKNMPPQSTDKTETLNISSKLDKVVEEVEERQQENAPARKLNKKVELKPKAVESRPATAHSSILDDGKKKKRKLLGGANKTLFDDEDGEAAAPPPVKPVLAHKRVRAKLGGGVQNAFAGASFSPLKRDRRGVNASFLA